jgi:hypothetical protein
MVRRSVSFEWHYVFFFSSRIFFREEANLPCSFAPRGVERKMYVEASTVSSV